MLAATLELHPEALEDAIAGYTWYLERSPVTADRFFQQVERTLELVLEGPSRWPPYLHGTRRILLKRFPYSVVYGVLDDRVMVYAFAHARRRPGYWKRRLDGDRPPIM